MNSLIIRSGGIGDALLTLTVAQALRDDNPETGIDVLGSSAMCEVARLSPLISMCHSLDHARFSALYGGSMSSEVRAFLHRYDMVYAFTAAEREPFHRRLLDAGAGACRVLDPREPADFRHHIAHHLLSIFDEPPEIIRLPDLAKRPVKRGSTVLIHPGSGGIRKNWSIKRFAGLARQLDRPVLFLLGPAEKERGIADQLPGRVIADVSLADVRDIMLQSALYVGNDSGMSHLAGMLGIPTLALFGPTDPLVWRPLGPQVRTLIAPGGAMDALTGDMVLHGAAEMLHQE